MKKKRENKNKNLLQWRRSKQQPPTWSSNSSNHSGGPRVSHHPLLCSLVAQNMISYQLSLFSFPTKSRPFCRGENFKTLFNGFPYVFGS